MKNQIQANMIKVTWELDKGAAREAIMRAGGDPSEESAIQDIIRRSRYNVKYPSGAMFGGPTDELQAAGYQVSKLEIV